MHVNITNKKKKKKKERGYHINMIKQVLLNEYCECLHKSTKILKIYNKKSKNLGKNIMADPEHLG
jgi:nitrous oxidase accessory protein NosD